MFDQNDILTQSDLAFWYSYKNCHYQENKLYSDSPGSYVKNKPGYPKINK